MNELQLTWARFASVWWLLTWRGILGGALVGGIAGGLIGLMGAMMGADTGAIQGIATYVGGGLGLGWGAFVLYCAMRKRYDGFRIALVPA